MGLGSVEVLAVEEKSGEWLRVSVRCAAPRPLCGQCGGVVWSDGAKKVKLADLLSFGRVVRLVWYKRRWRCKDQECPVGTVTEQATGIAPPRERFHRQGWASVGPSKRSPRSWDAVGIR